ncbi:UNVERIFIED_CONTAM: ferrochelatase [Kocuria sp. CPCC 205295]|uniref:ferrochelatase n=1 Tax=unclassified Kocuria TaxID=2649579 RepID=UPI0034D49C6C
MTAPGGAPVPQEPELAPSAVTIPSGRAVDSWPHPAQAPQLSRARAQEPADWDAIVLSSFGGPEGQDDVIPFLRNVTRGRGIPDDRLEAVAGHYRANGGVSPINAQNRALLGALEQELRERGIDTPITWANRNWEPYVADVLQSLHDQGSRRVLVLATSAFSGYSSCRQYREDWGVALEQTGLGEQMVVGKIRQYFDMAGFLEPFVDGLREALLQRAERGPLRILFAAHSVPDTDALAAGPETMREGFATGSAYADQLLAASRKVMERTRARLQDEGLSLPESLSWDLVFQSRSGPPSMPWLEPDINDAVEQAADDGADSVIVVPIGFVSDHMEVLWDLDTEARETAQERGLGFARTPTPGTHPAFVSGLADLIEQRMAGRSGEPRSSACSDGTWFDDCPADCCVKILRGSTEPRPTIAQRPEGEPIPVGLDETGQVVRA